MIYNGDKTSSILPGRVIYGIVYYVKYSSKGKEKYHVGDGFWYTFS